MLDIRKNYFQFLNLHALRAKMNTAMIPDPKLMIGTAEDLSPQPVLVYKDMTDAHYSILTKQLENLDSQRVEYGISQGEFEPDDFVSNTYYIGDPVSAGGI